MRSPALTTSTLRKLAFLSLLTENELAALLPAVQFRTYERRMLIIAPGDPGHGLYIVRSGRVNVLLENERGRQIMLEQLGEDDVFGELGVLNGLANTEVVESQTNAALVFLSREAVLTSLRRNSSAAMFLMNVMAARLAQARRTVGRLALYDVQTQVAEVMLEHGHEEGGHWIVDFGSERISLIVGASREMVSRVIGHFTARGIAARRKRTLIVLDRASLARYVVHGCELGNTIDLARTEKRSATVKAPPGMSQLRGQHSQTIE